MHFVWLGYGQFRGVNCRRNGFDGYALWDKGMGTSLCCQLKRTHGTAAMPISVSVCRGRGDSRGDVAEALQDDSHHKVLFLDYQPEPTDGAANITV